MIQASKCAFCAVFIIRRMITTVCVNTQIGFLSLYEIKWTHTLSSSLYHLFHILPIPETRKSDFWVFGGQRLPLGWGHLVVLPLVL